jgi:DNA-binding ferritin-like protein
MNTIAEHLQKARHNLAFLNTIDIDDDTCADWAIVVLFYRALHLVSAVIHSQGRDHGSTHAERQQQVDAMFPPPTAQSYRRLRTRSRVVRYEQVQSTAADFRRLLNSDFEPLLRDVRSHLPNAA